MPLTDTATVVAGFGHIWTGTVGTATKPTLANLNTFVSAGTVPATWTHFGHTDEEDPLAFGQDGGDSTVLRSWQTVSLRTSTDPTTDYFTIKSLQLLDNAVLNLYYGGGDATVQNEFALPDSPAPVERAVAVVIIDGTTPACFYVPRASIIRDDAMEFAVDDKTKVPLRFTILQASGQKRAIWISDALGAP